MPFPARRGAVGLLCCVSAAAQAVDYAATTTTSGVKFVAVCTTINAPTDAIKQVANVTGWCVVIVGDRKTPDADYERLERALPKTFKYLSYAAQQELPYMLVALTPPNHFSRKNIGFLYAAHAGAQLIFDFDDDNELLYEGWIPDTLAEASSSYVFASHDRVRAAPRYAFVNPYARVFGAPQMWPRGYPLDRINTPTNVPLRSETESVFKHSNVVLGAVQTLAQHDPDVDALYRLGPRSALPLPFEFDVDTPTLVLDKHVYSPCNAQAMVYTRSAFFALLLPHTVHGRVSDIWRGYIGQRLFWLAGLRLGFSAPFVTQTRNAHDFLADYFAERPLYEQAEEFVRVVDGVADGAPFPSVGAALHASYIALFEHGFVEEADVNYARAWLRDLAGVGLEPPRLH
mmetsp:Transcript_26392/g.91059  ORF Transcript_26392/g.91059 Transcript_26392/m.91059 type:complete len:401 (+) Transcript_26392:106-1308(+)